MNFSQKTKQLAKTAFPEWNELHEKIEQGDFKTVRAMVDSYPTQIEANFVMEMLSAYKYVELYKVARKMTFIYDLQNALYNELDLIEDYHEKNYLMYE